MRLFKEIHCAKCRRKTNLLFRTKLADENYLCSECTSMIPEYMLDSLQKRYTLEYYNGLIEYIYYSNKALRPIFQETHSYYNIHIDVEHGLFYIGKSVNDNTVFLRMRYVDDYVFKFTAEEIKEGTFGDKITGKILFRIQMGHPIFYHEAVLDCNVKVKAKQAFFGTEYRYENPKGMDEFMMLFESARLDDLRAYQKSLEDEWYDNEEEATELQQAMSLFMIDDLSDINLEQLKLQRNKLIKVYHPDKSPENKPQYAQKINAAFEILKQNIE